MWKNKLKEFLSKGDDINALSLIRSMLNKTGLNWINEILKEKGFKLVLKKKIDSEYSLVITAHAIERTNNYLKKEVTKEKMINWFRSGQYMCYSDMLGMGFRPNKDHKEDSVYLKIKEDLVAILHINEEEKSVAWVTTYCTQRRYAREPITEEEFNNLCKKKIARKRTEKKGYEN